MKNLFLLLGLLALASCRGAESLHRTATFTPPPASTLAPTIAPPLAATRAPSPTATFAPVPAEYRALYDELDKRLDTFAARLNALSKTESRATVFAGDLLAANGNRGEELLREQTFQGVQFYLDRLQALGARGVKVSIKYPLLESDFPRASEYVAFYKRVAQELRRRKMTMVVSSGAVFSDPTFSNVQTNYFKGMTYEKYRQGVRHHVETIAREVQPDYLTIVNEPSTQTMLTGVAFTPVTYTDLVNFVLRDLDRKDVLVGAGSGNWDEPGYVAGLAKNTTLDYIDLHVYPVNRDYLTRAFEEADTARAAGKRLIIGETWLYKAGENELGNATAADIFGRDVFSFWQPLDVKFLTLIAQFARQKQIEFVSPFWSKYFYAYLDYAQTPKGLTTKQLYNLVDIEVSKNMVANTPSVTGATYKKLASGE